MLRALTLGLSISLIFSTDLAVGAETGGDVFEKELYAPVEVKKLVKLPKRSYPALTEADKRNVLEAKQALSSFFISTEKVEQNPMDYLSPELQKKYGNRVNLHRTEFGAEAFLTVEVRDFEITKGGKEIEFNIFLTEITEGTVCTDQRTLALEKTPQGWKVSRFGREIR